MRDEQGGSEQPLLGVVLAGGASRRLGRDKALVEWQGRPLAGHVASIVAEVAAPVVLIGAAGRRYAGVGVPVVDDPPDLAGRGPLAGLLGAFRLGRGDVLLAACDMPLLDASFLRTLIAAATGSLATAVELDGRLHPLPGVYRAALEPTIRRLLARGGSASFQDLFALPGTRRLAAGQLGDIEAIRDRLANANTTQDLEALAHGRGRGS